MGTCSNLVPPKLFYAIKSSSSMGNCKLSYKLQTYQRFRWILYKHVPLEEIKWEELSFPDGKFSEAFIFPSLPLPLPFSHLIQGFWSLKWFSTAWVFRKLSNTIWSVFTFLERVCLVKGFIYLVKRAQDWLELMLNLDTLSHMKYANRTRAFWSLQSNSKWKCALGMNSC